MVKASLLAMVVLTVLVSMGLRWRDQRIAATQPGPRAGIVARGKRTLNRWVTAAAIAAVATTLLLGGLNWLRIANGG
jgi:hypothetical protein